MDYDVLIIGGGPTGSTCGTLLKKYQPDLRVLIVEREEFPRDHVGESQLPMIGEVLNEMGAWDKVEAANFPIKIGATYRWGRSEEPWDFEFVPGNSFDDVPRPGKFEGTRKSTAFQVDRSIYDKILLDHAAEMGVEVRENTKVAQIHRDGDRVTGVRLASGEEVTARYFVDGSGNVGIVRRAMDVPIDSPTALRNVAIWDYWQNAEWAVEIGTGGTRIQIMSLGYGWIWFIPIGPTRTSIGFVLPASYYRDAKQKPEEIYLEALAQEPRIAKLLKNATREDRLTSTKDWSYVAERTCGENWFLAGESAGFADPILSAGMTLAHTGAREAAYTLLALLEGEHDPSWLRERYDETQRARLRSHIQFADFWYTGNGLFDAVRENTSLIAKEAGLTLSADEAFRWLSTGGFANDSYDMARVATWDVMAMKLLAQEFHGDESTWEIGNANLFDLDLSDAVLDYVPLLRDGKIEKARCYRRDGKTLPNFGDYRVIITALRKSSFIGDLIREARAYFQARGVEVEPMVAGVLRALEAMVTEGWVKASFDPARQHLNVKTPEQTDLFHKNTDTFLDTVGASR